MHTRLFNAVVAFSTAVAATSVGACSEDARIATSDPSGDPSFVPADPAPSGTATGGGAEGATGADAATLPLAPDASSDAGHDPARDAAVDGGVSPEAVADASAADAGSDAYVDVDSGWHPTK